MADTRADPAWYTPETASVPVQAARSDPEWYAPEPVAAPAAATPTVPATAGGNYGDALNFLRTAGTKAIAGLAGLPRFLEDANNKGAYKHDAPLFPSADAVEQGIYSKTGPEYKPESTAGQYGMAGMSYALPAVLGAPETILPNAIRGGIAGVGAKALDDSGLPSWLSPVATALTEFLARRAAAVRTPHTTGGQRQIAGRVLNEAAPALPTPATPSFPGMQITTGQATNDPGMLALDTHMNNASADAQQSANAAHTGNKSIIRDQLDKVAGGAGGSTAAVAQGAAITDAAEAAKQAETAAWNNISPAIVSNTAPLKSALEAHVAGIDAGDRRFLPSADIQTIRDLPENASLRDVQSIRRNMLADARDAGKTSTNTQRVTNDVAALLTDHLGNVEHLRNGTAEDLADYQKAVQATKDYHAQFGSGRNQNPMAAKVVSGQTDASRALGQSLATPEGVSRLKLAVGTGTGLDPLRDHLVTQLKDATEHGPKGFGKVLDKYDYAFGDNHIFTPQQQQTFKDAREAVEQTYRKSAPGAQIGSDTYAGLNKPTFARVLYGNILGRVIPTATKVAGALTGGAASAAIGIPGAAEIGGTLIGKEGAENALHGRMSSARSSVLDILDRARRDPALARELQRNASSGNLSTAPKLRGMLKMLGLSEAQALPSAASQ